MLHGAIERVKELTEEIELLRMWVRAAESASEYEEAQQALQDAEEELLIFGVLE